MLRKKINKRNLKNLHISIEYRIGCTFLTRRALVFPFGGVVSNMRQQWRFPRERLRAQRTRSLFTIHKLVLLLQNPEEEMTKKHHTINIDARTMNDGNHSLTSTFCNDFSNSYASWKKFYVFLSLIVKRLILKNSNLPPHLLSVRRQQLPALLVTYVQMVPCILFCSSHAPLSFWIMQKKQEYIFTCNFFRIFFFSLVFNKNIIVSRINRKKTPFAQGTRTHTHTHTIDRNDPVNANLFIFHYLK